MSTKTRKIPEDLIPYLEKAESDKSIKRYTDLGLNTNEVSICHKCHRKYKITMFATKKNSIFHDDYSIVCRYCDDKDGVRCWELTRDYYKRPICSKQDDMSDLRDEYFDAPVITSKGEIDGLKCKWHSHLTKPIGKEKPVEVKINTVLDVINKIDQSNGVYVDELLQDFDTEEVLLKQVEDLKKQLVEEKAKNKPINKIYSTTIYNKVLSKIQLELEKHLEKATNDFLKNNSDYNIDGSVKCIAYGEECWALPNQDELHLTWKPYKKCSRGGSKRPCSQYDKNGNWIADFPSLTKAGEVTGIPFQNIWECCIGDLKHAGPYKWFYTENKP